MEKIDLGKLIEKQELDAKELAHVLFPTNKYPTLALSRILAGDGVLDANQISRLSTYTGISVADLYSSTGWKASLRGRLYIMQCGNYTAELDPQTWSTRIYRHDALFHEFILSSPAITLREYFEKLNSEISKSYKNDEN